MDGNPPTTGGQELSTLLRSLDPQVQACEFVFVSNANLTIADAVEYKAIASFQESEGLTLVVTKAVANALGESYQGVFHQITLGVHSSLDAVGLTAAVASALAREGIAVNVIAAYFHDHLFVPVEQSDRAIAILHGLGSSPRPNRKTRKAKE